MSNQIPTLIIGIGGIGCKIAGAISDYICHDSRPYVGFIGVDTNANDLATLREKHPHIETIQTSDEQMVSKYLELYPEYQEWFPDNKFLRERTMLDGAGQVRTLSRLAFLASEHKGRFSPILREVGRIRKVDDNPFNSTLAVMVVGSITGGTGAGLFLNMPFYLRSILKSQAGLKQLIIRGMFLGPDVMENVQPSKTNADAICVNGYTCLKELNAFYMQHSNMPNIEHNLRLDFYDHNDQSVNNIPYNYLYLVEKSSNIGGVGDAKVEEIIKYASRIIYTLLFSPVTKEARSIEDNFVLETIKEGGMNRFSGAGICRMIYPVDTARRYVTLSVVKELVQREWLLIDRSFEAISNAAISKMKSDATVKRPELKASYVEIFEKETIGAHPTLGEFGHEAYIEKNNSMVSRTIDYLAEMNKMIRDLMESDQVQAKKAACDIDEEKMHRFSDAQGHVTEVWENMRDLVKFAEHLIKTKPGGFADDLFPATWDVMQFHMDKPECIYKLLATVHPVTARFFIYDLINRLEELIKTTKPLVSDVNLYAYQEEDFDSKADGVQDPSTAVSNLQSTIKGLRAAFNGEAKALAKVKRQLTDAVDSHVTMVMDYMQNMIKLSVASTLLERLEALANNYAIFFSTVSSKIERNNEELERLENLRFAYGETGIYCTKEAFRRMAEEYRTKVVLELSPFTKKTIFEEIYRVQSRSFSQSATSESPAQKEKRVQEARDMLENVFSTAVIDTVQADVVEKGDETVNFSARQALLKEFELATGKIKDDKDYNELSAAFIQERIDTAMKIAVPMLTTDTFDPTTELRFLAVSPRCAEKDQNGNPDQGLTSRFYIKSFNTPPAVMISPDFSDNEITCMRAMYNYTIEQLTKYMDGSRNAEAYKARIENLGRAGMTANAVDEAVVVINPHLNCNWHEEGFVPSIHSEARKQDHVDMLKSYIFGLGLDCFEIINDDDHPDVATGKARPTWFAKLNGRTKFEEIKKCGRKIGNGYCDVYDALKYNRVLRKTILSDAREFFIKTKGYNTAQELFDGILENPFVQDLVQTEEQKAKDHDQNIFDIFIEMRTGMSETDWSELFTGLRLAIWEFLEILFDKNAVQVNKASYKILNAIYANSAIGKKDMKGEETLNYGEMLLKNQFDVMLGQKYE